MWSNGQKLKCQQDDTTYRLRVETSFQKELNILERFLKDPLHRVWILDKIGTRQFTWRSPGSDNCVEWPTLTKILTEHHGDDNFLKFGSDAWLYCDQCWSLLLLVYTVYSAFAWNLRKTVAENFTFLHNDTSELPSLSGPLEKQQVRQRTVAGGRTWSLSDLFFRCSRHVQESQVFSTKCVSCVFSREKHIYPSSETNHRMNKAFSPHQILLIGNL